MTSNQRYDGATQTLTAAAGGRGASRARQHHFIGGVCLQPQLELDFCRGTGPCQHLPAAPLNHRHVVLLTRPRIHNLTESERETHTHTITISFTSKDILHQDGAVFLKAYGNKVMTDSLRKGSELHQNLCNWGGSF